MRNILTKMVFVICGDLELFIKDSFDQVSVETWRFRADEMVDAWNRKREIHLYTKYQRDINIWDVYSYIYTNLRMQYFRMQFLEYRYIL